MNNRSKHLIVQFNVSGIKCDAKGCGWRDDGVSVDNYPAWVNRPCPACGANLLTEADFAATQHIRQVMESINRWINRLLPEWWLRRQAGGNSQIIPLAANGTGRIVMKPLPKDAA